MTIPIFEATDLSTVKPGFPVTPGIILASTFSVKDAIAVHRVVRSLTQFAWDNRNESGLTGSKADVLELARVIANPLGRSLRNTLTVESVLALSRNALAVHMAMYYGSYPWGDYGTAYLTLFGEELAFGLEQAKQASA